MEIVLDKNEINSTKNGTKTSSLKDLPAYKTNPFLEGLNIPLTPKSNMFVKRDEAIINLSSGNIQEDVLLTGKRRYVDGEHFVKIFVKEMEIIFDLTRPGQKLFTYMLSKVQYNDTLLFDIKECKASLRYKSESQIFIGIKELLVNRFIAKTSWTNVYWINPKLFYKGDRLLIVREYRKAKGKVIDNQLSLFEEDNINNKKIEELEEKDQYLE